MMRAWIALFLLSAAALGCSPDAEKETQRIKDTITRYTLRLQEGYAGMNMTPLKEAATEEQARKVYHHMAALGEANIRLKAELDSLEFVDVRLSPGGSARARTRERWHYVQSSIDTNIPVKMVPAILYVLSYELVMRSGRWYVSSVSMTEGVP